MSKEKKTSEGLLLVAVRRVDLFFETLSSFLQKRWLLVILATGLVTAAAGLAASGIRLESDFEAMLPENYQSVKDLRRYQREVASTSTLSIGVMTKDIGAAIRFAEDLAAILNSDMKDKIHYVEYNIKDVRDFFRRNALLYMDEARMQEKYEALHNYIAQRKLKETGLLIDIEDEGAGEDVANETEKGEDKPPIALEELVEEYNRKAADYFGTRRDGYYVNDAEDLLAITVYPRPGFTGVGNARKLVTQIEEKIASLRPHSYAPDLKVGLAGPVRISLDEYEAIRKDIVGTLGLCISLVVLVLFIYYMRIRPIILIALTLAVGITITMGITRFVIGYLNAQTAFLGSIIIGTGINYGIIFLARYMEERKGGRDSVASLRISMVQTWKATASAALTTAIAFATLGLSENLSFRQFGFIASSGIIIIWLVTVTVLPAMVVLSEKAWPLVRAGRKGIEIPFVPAFVARAIVSHPWIVISVAATVSLLSGFFIVRWLPTSLEYDFRNLRNRVSATRGVEELDARLVNEVTKESTSPMVAVTASLSDADAYCRAVDRKNRKDPQRYRTGECKTLSKYIPANQEEKIALLRKIDELLQRNRGLLPDDFRREYENHREMLLPKKVEVSSLPETIRRKFRNVRGGEGVLAAVFPVPGQDIWVYDNLVRFVSSARSVKTEDGKVLSASGAPVIFYDLVQTVAHDAPRNTLYAIVGVFLAVVLIVGRIRGSISLTLSLLVGVAAMAGAVALAGTKINFFNFIAIPTAFGTGADYGINVLMRYLSERGKRATKEVLTDSMVRTGSAVFLCSSTTIIGYLSLMTSNNLALVSYGKLAIAGEIACLLAALFLLPVLILKLKV